MKRFIIPLTIILLVVVLFSINYKKKGTFEELVLNEYLETSKAKDFDQIVFGLMIFIKRKTMLTRLMKY